MHGYRSQMILEQLMMIKMIIRHDLSRTRTQVIQYCIMQMRFLRISYIKPIPENAGVT